MNQLYLFHHYILYIGASFDTQFHRHHAAQICIGLEQPLQLSDKEGQVKDYSAAFITANTQHQMLGSKTNIAALFLDVRSDLYESLLQEYHLQNKLAIQSLRVPRQLLFQLNSMYSTNTTNIVAKQIFTQLLRQLASDKIAINTLDGRVLKVIDLLNASVDNQIPIEQLAAEVHLSSSRLTHLFKAEIGTSIRRYSLWTRIKAAVEYALSQQSLTQGSYQAGFSDSAHFSRVFKEMYGFKPSFLLNKTLRITDLSK